MFTSIININSILQKRMSWHSIIQMIWEHKVSNQTKQSSKTDRIHIVNGDVNVASNTPVANTYWCGMKWLNKKTRAKQNIQHPISIDSIVFYCRIFRIFPVQIWFVVFIKPGIRSINGCTYEQEGAKRASEWLKLNQQNIHTDIAERERDSRRNSTP